MATIQTNKLSVTLTDAEIADIKTAFETINTKLPFLLGLTTDERSSIPKINDSNKTFTEDAINAVSNNPDMLPGYFKGTELLKDLSLFKQLDEIALIAGQLSEKIDDTRMQAGSEAYISALTAYRLFGTASIAGVPGADAIYNVLKARFAEQGNNGTPAPVPDAPAPVAPQP